jgi:hypothetical protein
MKYYLIHIKQDEVVDTVDLSSGVGVSGARTYFVLRKQIESEKFDQIWKVMTEIEHKRMKIHDETIKEYEEFGSWLDYEKS